MADEECWIFGYGSLCWKNNDFEAELRKPGYVSGFLRRFYQNSIDHRGIPEKPGRVVTLIKSDDESLKVYGFGYKLPNDKKEEVMDKLDFREKNGYARCETKFFPLDGSDPKATIVYVANEENPSWNTNHNLEDIAKQILEASGPSGSNLEYAYKLADTMREYFPNIEDDHLFELEKILKRLEKEQPSVVQVTKES